MVFVLWQHWGEHVGRQLANHLATSSLTDVTICVGARSIKAHRMVLSFFSFLFKEMLEEVKEDRPMVILFPGINFEALQILVSYMYRGQVDVFEELLPEVIELAKVLKVKGLLDMQFDNSCSNDSNKDGHTIITQDSSHLDELNSTGLVKLEVTESDSENATYHSIQLKSPQNDLNSNKDDETPVLIHLSSVSDISNTSVVKCQLDQQRDLETSLLPDDYTYLTLCNEETEHNTKDEDTNTNSKTKRARAKYRPEDVKGAIENLKYSTKTLQEVAKEWGIPKSTLSLFARESGIKSKHRCPNYDSSIISAAIQAIRNGRSYQQVSKEFNIPKSVIWRKYHKQDFAKVSKQNYNKNLLNSARLGFLDGKSLSQIHKETKIPKPSLFRLKEQLVNAGSLPKNSIVRNKRIPRTAEGIKNLEAAIDACQVGGLSQMQASEKFQVPKATLWRGLKKLRENLSKTGGLSSKSSSYLDCHLVESEANNESCNNDADVVLHYTTSDAHDEKENHQANNCTSTELCMPENSEIFTTQVHDDSCGNDAFDIEMPLVSLSGESYQVVGSEIVIGGQQVVVLEPTDNTSVVTQNLSSEQTQEDLATTSIVVGTFDENGLVELGKVEDDDLEQAE